MNSLVKKDPSIIFIETKILEYLDFLGNGKSGKSICLWIQKLNLLKVKSQFEGWHPFLLYFLFQN